MAEPILMPQAGQTMTEGKIVQWFAAEGDSVRRGEPILEIETDKANMDVEAPADGVLRKVFNGDGETVPVLQVVGIVGAADEEIDFDALRISASGNGAGPSAGLSRDATPPPAVTQPDVPKPAPKKRLDTVSVEAAPPLRSDRTGRLRASPLARRVAEMQGVDIDVVRGSGPSGRIIRRDVEAASSAPGVGGLTATPRRSPYPKPAPRPPASVPMEGMRKAIAVGLQSSKVQAPHFYATVEVDVTAALAYREELKGRGETISINDLIVYAVAISLGDEPRVNCRVFDDRIEYPEDVNIGIAVGLEEGLVVPVVTRAGEKNLRGIAEETRRIIGSARNGKLVGSGRGTFTISNLGMFGVDAFTAIINPPEGAILAVGRARPQLLPIDGGFFPRTVMNLTLSADHRAIDGVLAARFLARMKSLLESPEALA